MLKEQLGMAIDSLRANKFRSLLTMLGIIIGTGTLVAVLSLGNAVQGSVFQQFIDLGTRSVVLAPGDKTKQGARDVADWGLLSMRDYAAIEQIVAQRPDLFSTSAPVVNVPLTIRSGTTAFERTVVGTTAEFSKIRNARAAHGRFITDPDNEQRAPVAVIGGKVAESLFGTGEAAAQAAVGKIIIVNNRPIEIVGVLGSNATIFGLEEQIFVPIDTLQLRLANNLALPGRGVELTSMLVGLQSEQQTAEVGKVLTAALRSERGLAEGVVDDFEITLPDQPLSILRGINSAITGFIAVVALISLVVGGIGITNIMLVAVTERTREIGVRKALGATDGDILVQFLLESAAVSLIGGVIGVTGAIGLVLLIGAVSGIGATIAWGAVLISLLFAAVVGIGFGTYPARRASLLLPVEALRYE